MFYITDSKGFQIKFDNNWTISVQFGPGNYCDNYDLPISQYGYQEAGSRGSKNAEVAIISPDDELIEHESFCSGDSVKARVTPKEVLELMIWVEKQ